MLRQNDYTGFALASQIMQSSFKLGAKQMEMLCKKSGPGQKTTQRLHPQSKEPLEIYQHQYKHQAGIAYFYENTMENTTLEETLQFNFSGLEISGLPGQTKVNFVLKPGSTKLIELKAISFPWKIATGISYGIR